MRHCDKFNPLFLSLRKISVNWLEWLVWLISWFQGIKNLQEMEITAWILAWFFYPANFLFILFINLTYCRQSHLLSLKIYIFFTSIFFVWDSGELCERDSTSWNSENWPNPFKAWCKEKTSACKDWAITDLLPALLWYDILSLNTQVISIWKVSGFRICIQTPMW